MLPSGKALELCMGRVAIRRLMKHLPVAFQDLIGPEHHPVRMAAADRESLFGRKPCGQRWRVETFVRSSLFDGPLIDAGILRFDEKPRAHEEA